MTTRSELELEQLLVDTLFVEFVHRSPMLSDGSKELADVLVLFRDTLLIFQVKMPSDDAHAQRTAEKRRGWMRKNREKAIDQVGTTWRYIASGKATELQNIRFPKQALDARRIQTVIGVAVVGDEDDACDEPAKLVITKAGRDIPVVTLTMRQLRAVLAGFDTVADFVGAVKAMVSYGERLAGLRRIETPISSCLAAIVSYIDKAVNEDRVLYVMSNTHASRQAWKEFSDPGGVAELRREGFPASRLIDHIIMQLHQCAVEYPRVRSWVGTDALKREQSSWHELAERLASLNRGQRDAYGSAIVAVLEASASPGRRDGHNFRVANIDGLDWALVFSASPGTRKDRLIWLSNLVEIVRATRGFRRVLGIATEPAGPHGASFQFVWPEGEPIDLNLVPADLQPLVDCVRNLRIAVHEPVLR